jgi:serine/threonine protein kinase
MTLSAGMKLGSYEILSHLGTGGMGEVYRAMDTKLAREVAIKVLSGALVKDQERLARFEREARILASLNHSNIAAIYSLEEFEGQSFLVLELVAGNTLAELIAKGPLNGNEALAIFDQIAAALEAAHEKAIIHRDIKPANVKITPEGIVKVLDFGLAKMTGFISGAQNVSQVATLLEQETQEGTIVGTIGYMSPEQARGKSLDKQTDIWSFGCILFEALSGCGPFARESISDTLAAILMSDPDWRLLPASIPSKMKNLIVRCLQKDVHQRIRDISDARLELEEMIRPSSYSHPVLMQLTSAEGIHEFPAWALDGKHLAYSRKVGGFKEGFY